MCFTDQFSGGVVLGCSPDRSEKRMPVASLFFLVVAEQPKEAPAAA